MTWPAIILWILIAGAVASRGLQWLFYMFYISGAFGTLLMVPGNAVGGINLLAQSFCAVFIVTKLAVQPKVLAGVAALALDFRKLGFLALFLVWSLFTAYVMPRVFMGRVNVVPIVPFVPDPQPLVPTAANLTQSAYIALSIGLVLVCAAAGRTGNFFRYFLHAVLLGGLMLIITGFLDLLTQGTELLAPFRNANYALLTDAEILGSKRMVGLMPEASSYGAACVGILGALVFLRQSFEGKLRSVFVPITIFGLITVTILSTSSTGYAGLGVLAAVYAADLLLRAQLTDRMHKRGVFWEVSFLMAAAVVFLGLVILKPSMFDPLSNLFDSVVLQKSTSDSYIERSGWTRYAWQAFLDTDGWGVGLGSARSSSWYFSVLSNTGFIGAALMGTFLLQTFLRRTAVASGPEADLLRGLKFSAIPNFVMAGLAGTTPDFGAHNAIIFGLITALSSAAGKERISQKVGETAFDTALPSRCDE